MRQLIKTSLISGFSLLAGCAQMVNHAPIAPETEELFAYSAMENAQFAELRNEQVDAAGREGQISTENPLGLLNQTPGQTPQYFYGSGTFVGNNETSLASDTRPVNAPPRAGKDNTVTLNFKQSDIQDVAKVILGTVLKRNYVIDPSVSGVVNIQTHQAFDKQDLLPILADLLQMHGATLVESNDLIKIVPLSDSVVASLPPSFGANLAYSAGGVHTRIVPLRFVGAMEMQKILQPLSKEATATAYPERNVLMLSGSQKQLNRLLQTIQMFDVDWLKGMSLAMVPLQYAEATDIVSELDSLFGQSSNSPLASLIRFMPLARLNAVIVISQQPHYLREMTQWIKRLDRSDGMEGYQLYVYPVQNKRAEELARVLNNIFNTQQSLGDTLGTGLNPSLAPGLEPVTLTPSGSTGTANTLTNSPAESVNPGGLITQAVATPRYSTEGVSLPGADSVRIIADESDNSLVILASPTDYMMVERAIKKLDTTPLQVLIEASIVEVSLTDELSYGLEWFFKNETGIGNKNGQARLDLGAAGLNTLAPGFSYGIVDAAGAIRGVLNTLASESKVNVISSPSLMVLDNHTATINIGDQVPILTSQSTSNLTENAVTVNQIEYRDTGVIMEVTPRVNASGLVVLDINQEVTDVTTTESSGIDAPTFQRRSIESTISVNNGHSIILGGLIRDNRAESESGIPVLHKAPLVGPLFGSTDHNMRRTELVVILTPRAILDPQDALAVTDEFKHRLKVLRSSMPTRQ